LQRESSPRKISRRLLIAIITLAIGATRSVGARAVWIDTDLALGSPWREVDDGYAVALALRSPELRIAGISTTSGNARLAVTTRRTRQLLGTFASTLPVYAGEASAHALAAVLRKEKMIYVALGPLTNLAYFLKLHREQANRLEQIIIVAGQSEKDTLGFGPREKFRIHDANFIKDPEAMRTVLRTQIPLLIIPIETAARLQLDRQDLDRIEQSEPAGRYLAQRSRVWLWFWQHFVREKGGPIFDALAIVAAARPTLLTTEKRRVAIEGDGRLVARRAPTAAGRPVTFCSGFAPATKAFVSRRLANEKKRRFPPPALERTSSG
jgi:inosine-uridine nucleoside N-ribohydrolase